MKNNLCAIPDKEWQGPRDTAWKAIQVADYRKAIDILSRVYRKYPKDSRVIPYAHIPALGVSIFKSGRARSSVFTCIFSLVVFGLSVNSVLAVPVSSIQEASKTIISENQSVPVAETTKHSPGVESNDWQGDLIFFSDSIKGFPALAVTRKTGKSGWMLFYSNSQLPDIRKKAIFMRSAGVRVKVVTTEILVPDGSTATYRQDLLDELNTRTQFLELFYYRQVYNKDFFRAGLLAGIPLVWHDYSAACTLEDNTRFSESGRALGVGLTPGLVLSFGSVSGADKGFVGSMYLLYNKLWFKNADGKLSSPLRSRLNEFRIGFSAAWRFNS